MPLAEHDADLPAALVRLDVSIHVPLAEHDIIIQTVSFLFTSFNSRAPRGARRASRGSARPFRCFNSRAPRGARRVKNDV